MPPALSSLNSYNLNLGGSGFLGNSELQRAWGRLIPWLEDDVSPEQHINEASVDLTLGSEYFVTSNHQGCLSAAQPTLVIPHGEFAALTTREIVHIPTDTLGLITMKFTFKQKGLMNVSGFHVDPGYKGQIIYTVYNAGPTDIVLRWKERVFTIFLSTLVSSTDPYKGANFDGIPSSILSSLGGSPANLVQVNKRLDTLEARLTAVGAVAVGVLVPLAIYLLST